MSALRRFFLRLVNVVRPGRAEPDLAREVASHLALLEDEFVRRGMSAADAGAAAKRAFGGIEHTKDLHRDSRSFMWLDDLRRDFHYAARTLPSTSPICCWREPKRVSARSRYERHLAQAHGASCGSS